MYVNNFFCIFSFWMFYDYLFLYIKYFNKITSIHFPQEKYILVILYYYLIHSNNTP